MRYLGRSAAVPLGFALLAAAALMAAVLVTGSQSQPALALTTTPTFTPIAPPTSTPTPTATFPAPTPTPANTTLTAPANPGDTTIQVVSSQGFHIGNLVTINPNAANEESAIVTGVGSLTLDRPLACAHAVGEFVEVVAPFGTGTCSPTPTPTPDCSQQFSPPAACATPTPTPNFATYTPTPVGTHALGGAVCRGPYDPNFCEYLYAFPNVVLQPLDWSIATGYHGNFQFDGVPNGQYTLSLSPSCVANAIGGESCYAPQVVNISGSDAFVTWKPFAEATPTPTNTPCTGACPTPDCTTQTSPPVAGCPTFTPTATPTPPCNTSPPDAGCVDSDGDFWPDNGDNCPGIANNDQNNTDAANTNANRPGADGFGDPCDGDIDGDGYTNTQETSLITGPEDPNLYCTIMRADLDGDRAVSILDLTLAANKFTQTIPPAPDRYRQDADFTISILDLTRMANVFTQNVSACP